MKDTLVQRLRDRAYSLKAADPLMEEAANEIERLRGYRDMAESDRDVAMLAAERLRLTDEERKAIAYAELTLRCETHPACERHTATLRSLLKRLVVRSSP